MTQPAPPDDAARVDRLAFYLLKGVNRAVREHEMIAEGARVFVAVSGGKDSLTLLDLLHRRRRLAREGYDLIAGHVRSDGACGRGVPVAWLDAWCREREIPLVTGDLRVADEIRAGGAGACFLCARRRRRAVMELARAHDCRLVALGHHADDLAETALLNLFFNARLETMAPRVALFRGEMTVIRPLAYLEERDIVTFARASSYPILGEPCPYGETSQRALVRRLLRELESGHHTAKRCILAATARVGQEAPIDHHQNGVTRERRACARAVGATSESEEETRGG